MLERYVDWQGNLERLVATVGQVFDDFDLSDDGEITVRMVRDYIQRGILGDVDRAGRELEFTYEHLLKLVLSRVLLRDGWSLRKIAEHFDFSDLEELEDLFPNSDNPALSTIRRLRSSVEEPNEMRMSMSEPRPRFGISKNLARRTSIQQEMRQALRKLGLPEDGPATEDVTLLAIAPWFQVLMDKDRIKSLSREDAEDLGKAVTASLTQLILKRGERK
jgi:DNA-binding transcriptional MerR regulator